MITLFIDNKEIKTKNGNTILWTALDNNLYIPNLCSIRDVKKQSSSCRLCFVEVEGQLLPVTACSTPASEKMRVHLNTPKVNKIRKTAFDLLLSNHPLDCHNCIKNKRCELQNIAFKLGLKLTNKNLHHILANITTDNSHPEFYFDRNKCILCGKCIIACNENGTNILDYAYRGIKTIVTTFKSTPLSESGCSSCLSCVSLCPVGALGLKNRM